MQSSAKKTFSVGVVILAAGSSRRMGQPKLLLPWRDTTVLGHLIQSWKELRVGQLSVVISQAVRPLQEELDRLLFPNADCIINPDPDRGMFSSIQCAASWAGWKKELTHWVITLGDQPHLRSETLRTLLRFGAANPEKICQPIRNGRPRHPVLLPRSAFHKLAGSTASNLKDFLRIQARNVAGFESADEGLELDMDTPADYEKLKVPFLRPPTE